MQILYKEVTSNGKTIKNHDQVALNVNKVYNASEWISSTEFKPMAWMYIFNKKFLNDNKLYFFEGIYHEDTDKLSGGQKQLVNLAAVMAMHPKVLILDEPTDHLDMESITALNNGLIKFPGVLLFSSRDHQIVETTANRIMEIVNGKLIDKITTYDEYLANDEMARKRQVFTVTDSEEEDD